MLPAPVHAPSYPTAAAPPLYAAPPVQRPTPPVPPPAAPAAAWPEPRANRPAAAPARPVFRAQMEEPAESPAPPVGRSGTPSPDAGRSGTPSPDGRKEPLVLPPPEQLGVAAPRPAAAGTDWAEAHRRLEQLGAHCFQLQKLTEGGCRCVCLLPTAQAGRSHRVEASAASEAEAVRRALDEAESWARAR